MNIKSIIYHVYTRYLLKKWHMKWGGASILASSFIRDYRESSNFFEVFSAHRKGFSASDWKIMGLNKENCGAYISNAQYYAKHPFNGQYSKWIDDKLTLKYLCAGTSVDKYLPAYYFMLNDKGQVLQLIDCPKDLPQNEVEGIIELLKVKRYLAIKRISGSIGEGFYKAEFIDNCFYLNGIALNKDDFAEQVKSLRDYIIIEYLFPHESLAKYCPNTCNCIRYLVGRIDGSLKMIKGYIRFGTAQSGFVENYNTGGVLCYLNAEGYFKDGNVLKPGTCKNVRITRHPDSNMLLEGQIPQWDGLLELVSGLDVLFPQLDYMGIDIVITSEHEVKMLEINSLTSLDTIQLIEPVTDNRIISFLTEY